MPYSKNALLLLLGLAMYSCRCKASFSFQTFLKNNSNYKVELVPYKNGVGITQQAILLAIAEHKSVSMANGPISLFDTLDADSIQVLFDDSIKVVHYSFRIANSGKNPKAIKYDQLRSLFNHASFENTIEEQSKCSTKTNQTYTFNEQDYIDAKR